MEEKKSSITKWIVRVVLFATLTVFIGVGAFIYWFLSYQQQAAPPLPSNKNQVSLTIPKGASFLEIKKILAENGLIKDDVRFTLLARYLKVAHKIKAGEFRLTAEQKPEDLLRELLDAKAILHKITIPEGLNIKEIAKRFAKKDWCSYDDFVALANNQSFIEKLGFKNITSLEGYLFPDTYSVTREMKNAEKAIILMTDRFKKVWAEIMADKKGDLVLSQHEIVSLAAIVEKEAVKAVEQPVIAGVFYNRLQKRMRLQSDPTVLYGVDNHTGPITKTDLRRATPYNTYVISGLPPGPICNPGEGALRATVNPQKTNYLYFVSNNDGTHQFSKNLQEHNLAVRKYRKSVKLAREAAKKNQSTN